MIICYIPIIKMLMDEMDPCLELQWISSFGVEMNGTCSLIHPGPCSLQLIRKIIEVSKLGFKYYLTFHLVPLILRLRKSNTRENSLRIVKRTMIEYCKSVMFMIFLVGGSKAGLCFFSSKLPIRLNGRYLLLTSWLPGMSILFEHHSRRCEIGYFVLAKALHSLYLLMKRTKKWPVTEQGTILHVVLMAICYYIFNHCAESLKFKQFYESLWGQD